MLKKYDPVKTEYAEWRSCCHFDARLKTTGPCGGDAGHGGYTEVSFQDRGGTCMEAGANGGPVRPVANVTLRFRGDDEMQGLATLLDWLNRELKRHAR